MIGPRGENLVFLLGVPRSGTTLLSALLDRHPQILCPPEPWIMLALQSLGQTHPSHPADPQLLGDATRAFLGEADRDDAFRAFVLAVINARLAAAGRSVFIDKTPRYYLILPTLRRLFPAARYLWLIRNPLDVAASFLTSWNIDIAKQLADFPSHRACIDLVVGLRRLNEFAKENDRICSLRYEDLAAQPAEAIAKALDFLALPPANGLSDRNLAESPLATSAFGDQNIRQTDRPHHRSIDSWQRALSNEQLQPLLDALGSNLFTQLGYAHTLEQLAGRGIRACESHLADRVEAGLAERLAEVHAGTTLQTGPLDESAALSSIADLQPTAMAAVLAELRNTRQEIPRLTAWAASLEERLAHAEVLADKAEHVEKELAIVRQQNEQLFADLHTAQNEALAMRAAKENLERPGALFAVEFRRLQRNLRRLTGKNGEDSA
ncbi:MAG TPA: sulfotransferase [Tepidisphaeraceae bacterium]|jgi:hypothetical protein|nr:sulfotransferase [Tepidisphaeraceae bacterium]